LQGKYLLLIGKASAAIGSKKLILYDRSHRPPRPGEQLQIEGDMYTVVTVRIHRRFIYKHTLHMYAQDILS